MTAAELAAFIAQVRVELDDRTALLDATDPNTLPPELRADYDAARAACDELRAMVTDQAVLLQMEAAMLAGRDLTLEEAKALVRRH